jgi:hypothetical protein
MTPAKQILNEAYGAARQVIRQQISAVAPEADQILSKMANVHAARQVLKAAQFGKAGTLLQMLSRIAPASSRITGGLAAQVSQ